MFRLSAIIVISLLLSNTAFAHERHWHHDHAWRHRHRHHHDFQGYGHYPRYEFYAPRRFMSYPEPMRHRILPPPAGYYAYPPHLPGTEFHYRERW